MIIIHVLSQFQVTGAEVYAVTLANQQIKDGHKVFIVSDTLTIATDAEYIPYPIGNRRYAQRLSNILFIRRLIKSKGANIVHAHSRASSWVASFAVRGLKVPLISTVHGRQHVHASSKAADIYGDRLITVCQNLKTHLVNELNLRPEKITTIPNGFNFINRQTLTAKETKGTILTIAGRTSGPKGERTANLIVGTVPKLLQNFPNLQVCIVGGPIDYLPTEAQKIIPKLVSEFGERFQFIGFTNALEALLAKTDILIASGRIAIEGLWFGCEVLALGESEYTGPVKISSLKACMNSNFGDIVAQLPLPAFNPDSIYTDVSKALGSPLSLTEREGLATEIKTKYNLDKVLERIMDIYKGAIFRRFKPKHIPVLMYHKIPDAMLNSRHRIFVPKAQFEKHLRFLSLQGFTSITFKDYDDFREGRKPITEFPKRPVLLTFDDAYLDNLTNALPLMVKYGFTGTVFSLGDENHKDNFWDAADGEQLAPLMNTIQKKQLMAAGIEFGAHTMNHKKLTELSASDAFYEIAESKKQLERQLGEPVISFAYPYGYFNDEVEQMVAEAGLKYAVVINGGGLHLEEDPMAIFRVYIFPEDGTTQLRKKTSSWYRLYLRWKRGV